MNQVSPVPDPALFHVDLQKAFALIPWGKAMSGDRPDLKQ